MKTVSVLCIIIIDEPSFLELPFDNTVQQNTWTAMQTVIDTWGRRCSQMIMFGNVPTDTKVDSIPFLAVRNNGGSAWKSFAQLLTQVMAFLLYGSFKSV